MKKLNIIVTLTVFGLLASTYSQAQYPTLAQFLEMFRADFEIRITPVDSLCLVYAYSLVEQDGQMVADPEGKILCGAMRHEDRHEFVMPVQPYWKIVISGDTAFYATPGLEEAGYYTKGQHTIYAEPMNIFEVANGRAIAVNEQGKLGVIDTKSGDAVVKFKRYDGHLGIAPDGTSFLLKGKKCYTFNVDGQLIATLKK